MLISIRMPSYALYLISPNPDTVTFTHNAFLSPVYANKRAEATDGVCIETLEHDYNIVLLVANAEV